MMVSRGSRRGRRFIAGLLVASSIVYFAGTHPRILGIPVIGLFGYLIAGGLALWIAVDTIRGPRKSKKR